MASDQKQIGLLGIVRDLFRGRERWLLVALFAWTTLSAVLEMLAVASIVPFFALLLNPESASLHPATVALTHFFGVSGPRSTLLLVGGISIGALLASNLTG